jgi:XTP/dITP diphosphohydrolase
MTTITVATKNLHKLDEFRLLLAPLSVEIQGLSADTEESPESGTTFAANAMQKASFYGRDRDGWVLADDSGLSVAILGGEPGVYSARYAGEHGNDEANNRKLLDNLCHVHADQRSARFICCLALWNEQLQSGMVISGHVDGIIAEEPIGRQGFGYDPLFYLPHLGCTMGQLSREQKSQLSHRARAVDRLVNVWLGGNLHAPLHRE